MPLITTCPLCEAMCGLTVSMEGDRIDAIRGDDADPLSRGHICPKALALKDIYEDKERLRHPQLKRNGRFHPIPWKQALDHAARSIHKVQAQHGRDAVATYLGNPNVHNLGAMMALPDFLRTLGSRNRFSASSVDQWPHQQVAHAMFGHQFAVPVPDLDRTGFLVIMGGNPLASNGSLMTAPDVRKRLKSIVDRGGELVVIDPRRTETAAVATQHLPIAPGGDVFLMAAVLQTLLEEGLVQQGPWTNYSEGFDQLETFVRAVDLSRLRAHTGLALEQIQTLARAFAAAETAAWYGRMGVSTQRFGATTQWLIQSVNILANRLDQPGGIMFAQPAVSLLDSLSPGHYDRWRSRVRGLPEFAAELPAICLSEEMETSGAGQVKGLVVVAGNPVLSTPDGPRLERAIQNLDFTLAIDFYINETNRHADLILPPVSPLERDHYDLVFHQFAVRDTVKFSPALIPPAKNARNDGQILAQLTRRLAALRGLGMGKRLGLAVRRMLGTRRMLDMALRRGPYKLTLKRVMGTAHGIDLGPLKPQLPGLLKRGTIALAPQRFLDDLGRINAQPPPPPLSLIGRRHLLTNNSWLRQVPFLTRDPRRGHLKISRQDAESRGLIDGGPAILISDAGQREVRIQIDDAMKPGVVSLPHGFGDCVGVTGSANANALTHSHDWDRVSGNAMLNGVAVRLTSTENSG